MCFVVNAVRACVACVRAVCACVCLGVYVRIHVCVYAYYMRVAVQSCWLRYHHQITSIRL